MLRPALPKDILVGCYICGEGKIWVGSSPKLIDSNLKQWVRLDWYLFVRVRELDVKTK